MMYDYICNECKQETQSTESNLLDRDCKNELMMVDAETGQSTNIDVQCQGKLNRVWTRSIHTWNLKQGH